MVSFFLGLDHRKGLKLWLAAGMLSLMLGLMTVISSRPANAAESPPETTTTLPEPDPDPDPDPDPEVDLADEDLEYYRRFMMATASAATVSGGLLVGRILVGK